MSTIASQGDKSSFSTVKPNNRYPAFDYDIKFFVTTIDNKVHDLSKMLYFLKISFSIDDITPFISIKMSVPNYLLSWLVDKPWTGDLTIYTRRKLESKELTKINQFKVMPVVSSMKVNPPGKSKISTANQTYANLLLDLFDVKSTTLLNSYVYAVWDIEEHKEKNKLSYFICELFNQANKKSKLNFVFNYPEDDRLYQLISVPKSRFFDAIVTLHNSFGLYKTMPIMYSDGETFYLVSLEDRAKNRVRKTKCSQKDDTERHKYSKVSDRKDKAVLIHTSAREKIEDIISPEEYVTKGVYHVYAKLDSSSNYNDMRIFLPNKIQEIYEYEDYLYEYNDKMVKDYLIVDSQFSSGKNDFIDSEIQKDLRFVVNRKVTERLTNSLIQNMSFNSTVVYVIISPPLIYEHFKPGFTYRFISSSEHFENMNGRYLSREVTYTFARQTQIAWSIQIEMYLTTASIRDLG